MLALQAEADGGMGDGEAAQHVRDRLCLRPVALQEFEPRRREGEEIADLDARAEGGGGRPDHTLLPGLDDQCAALGRIAPSRRDSQPRDRADRRQRLAAEAERADGEEIAIG